MKYINQFLTWFWSPTFWLPPNIHWEDLRNQPGTVGWKYPESKDLWVPIYLAIVLVLIRHFFEKYFARPLGRTYNLSEKNFVVRRKIKKKSDQLKHNNFPKKTNTETNGFLNNVSHCTKSNSNVIPSQLNILKSKIKYLMASKPWQSKPGQLTKFSESCWRFTYYILAFSYGVFVLWEKPWFWDSNESWVGYPFQLVSPGMYWYYMIEMAFYWSLMVSQFKDVKRKDFWQMFVHHVCTLVLMTFSWIDNMVRIGTLVLVIHDAVDFWMEAAKMANYCKLHKLCNTLFAIFTFLWFVTRLCIYPYRIIYPALFIAHLNMDSFFAAYFLYNGLLILLLVLHVFWFIVICKIAHKSLKHGNVEKDERSCSESESPNSTTNEHND